MHHAGSFVDGEGIKLMLEKKCWYVCVCLTCRAALFIAGREPVCHSATGLLPLLFTVT